MRPVYACSLDFPPTAADAIWAEIAAWVNEWYDRKSLGAKPPATWPAGTTPVFTYGSAHSLEATRVELVGHEGPLREMRWNYPDQYDPSLVWSVDTTVFKSAEATRFSLVLRITSALYELLPAKYSLGSPRIVRTLVARGDARVGDHALSRFPNRIDASDVPTLVALVRAPERRHAVVVISPDTLSGVPVIDADAVANAVPGLASVHVLGSKWAAFALSDELGRPFSCFNGAVRIYWPRFSEDSDATAHRLWVPSEIGQLGSEGLARSIFRSLAIAASFRFVEPEPIRLFRRRAEEARVSALKADKGGGYDALFDEYVKLDTEVRTLRETVDTLTKENGNFRANLAALWTPTQQPVVPNLPEAERPTPTDVHDAVVEAQRRTTNVVYLPEAFDSAKDSPFKQPDKAFSALLAIDDVARRWAEQLGGGAKLGPRKEAFRQRGFDYADDISGTSEGRWGDEYKYEYEGTRIVFAPHITIGAKQADKCLSIHMHWDNEKRRVVIAHVGRHKTNTRT